MDDNESDKLDLEAGDDEKIPSSNQIEIAEDLTY